MPLETVTFIPCGQVLQESHRHHLGNLCSFMDLAKNTGKMVCFKQRHQIKSKQQFERTPKKRCPAFTANTSVRFGPIRRIHEFHCVLPSSNLQTLPSHGRYIANLSQAQVFNVSLKGGLLIFSISASHE